MENTRFRSYAEKIAAIQEWAESKPWFNCGLVDSIEEQLRDNRDLSDRQKAAIDNIVTKFHIKRPYVLMEELLNGNGMTVRQHRFSQALFSTSS